jgi:farnesyl diphosphate synthase
VLGADRARNKAEILIEEAVIMLDNWDEEAQALRDLARYVLKRTN